MYFKFWGNFFKFKFIYFNWRLITLQFCIGSGVNFGLEVSYPPETTEANNLNLDDNFFKLGILFVLFLKNIKKKQHAERSHILNALVQAYGKKKKKKKLENVTFWENN